MAGGGLTAEGGRQWRGGGWSGTGDEQEDVGGPGERASTRPESEGGCSWGRPSALGRGFVWGRRCR